MDWASFAYGAMFAIFFGSFFAAKILKDATEKYRQAGALMETADKMMDAVIDNNATQNEGE